MQFSPLLLLLIILSLLSAADCKKRTLSKPKKAQNKNWDQILSNVDKEWEQGDESEELTHDFEINRLINQKKSPQINFDNPEEVKKHFAQPFALASTGGGSNKMAFVELNDMKPNGKPWRKQDIDDLASRWVTMLRTGSQIASIYNIGEDDEPRLLVSMDKVWMMKDILKFILTQSETKKISLDNKDYLPTDYDFDNDDEL